MAEIWTIYRPGGQHAGYYRVRRWLVEEGEPKDGSLAGLGTTLEAAREVVPSGLTRRDRQPDDDANIVEIWV